MSYLPAFNPTSHYVLVADSTVIGGMTWAPAPAQFILRAGEWHLPGINSSTNNGILNGDLRAVPYWCSKAATITDLAIETTAAAGAGGLYRLGVYASDGTGTIAGVPGKPGELMSDCGTIDVTPAASVKTITGLSIAVTAGTWIWLAGVVQGNPTGTGTYRTVGTAQYCQSIGSATPTSLNPANIGYTVSSVTGALPTPFGTPTITGAVPRIAFKVA